MCGLTVENELICVNPQTSQLGQNVYHLQTPNKNQKISYRFSGEKKSQIFSAFLS